MGSPTDLLKFVWAQIMMVKNFLERDHATMRLVLTEQGRAVLSVLLSRSGITLPASG